MSNRGFACIALDNPKFDVNIGGVFRAAGVYDADLIVVSKGRFRRWPTDTTKAWRHIPTLRVESVLDAVPYNCVPIAVDLLEGATPLPEYVHPERAFYIFGAEDATLGKRILDHCRDRVVIPTNHCMNLAATVNVVLYDRLAKRG